MDHQEKQQVIDNVLQNTYGLRYTISQIPTEIRGDKDILMAIANSTPSNSDNISIMHYIYKYVEDESIFNDKSLILSLMTRFPGHLISIALLYSGKITKDILLHAVSIGKIDLSRIDFDKSILNDEDLALNLVKNNPSNINFVPPKYIENFGQDFIMNLARSTSGILQFVYTMFLENENMYYGEILDNYNIVLAAVRQSGNSLQYASERLRDNEDIVLAAVRQSGNSLQYASERLRDNETIALEAIKPDISLYHFSYISRRLREDENFMLRAVEKNISALGHASEKIRDNEKIISQAAKQDDFFFGYVSHRLQNSKKFIIDIIRNYNPMIYADLKEEMQKDKDIYSAYVNSMPAGQNNISYHKNQKYHILKGKFLSIINQINDLKSKQNNKNKAQINNQVGKLKSELSRLKYYNEANNIINEEEIDKLLLSIGTDEFVVREDVWEEDSGQNFTNSDEKVIIIEWDKSILQRFINDPIMIKFFSMNARFAHFRTVLVPIGFALVYEKDKSTWVINEIQSDLIAELQQIKKSNYDKKYITKEELLIQLKANGKEKFYNEIINTPEYLEEFLSNPELIQRIHSNSHIGDIVVNHIADSNKDDLYLSPSEYNHVYSQIGYLLDNWYKIVFHTVWLKAREAGIQHLYMNTSETVSSDLSKSSKKIHYESYPKELGFQKQKANLRDKDETFWYRKASIDQYL